MFMYICNIQNNEDNAGNIIYFTTTNHINHASAYCQAVNY